MPLDYRITAYAPNAQSILFNDASADVVALQYEDTPTGCGAAKLTLGMFREDATSLGYYDQFNIFEISSGDMRLAQPCAAGATKIYLDTTEPIDASQGEDGQVLYFEDGVNLTMRVPVTSIGSDSGGVYANIGAPDGLAGNPLTLPAYGAGAIVGRRRYAGRLSLISSTLTREPTVAVTLVGLSVAWSQAVGSVTVTAAANIDVGVALYTVLQQFQSTHWPFFTLAQANFPTTSFIYADTLTTVSMDSFISDALGAIPNADAWYVRVGHDRTPRLVRAFNSTTQTYTWTRTLVQGVANFEAQQVEIDEENTSNVYNAIQVTGGTAVGTGQPITVQVNDPTSITDLGFQIDGAPVSNTALSTIAAASTYGEGLLAQKSIATAANKLLVWTDDDAPTALFSGGPIRGDVLRALACIKVTGFDKTGLVTNAVPDSVIQYGGGPDQLWTAGSGVTLVPGGSPDGQTAFSIAGTGGGINSAPIYVAPGQTWLISGWANTTGIGSGGGTYGFYVRDATTFANIAFSAAPAATTGTTTPTKFVIPGGTTAIVVTPYVITHSGATGAALFAQPNLVRGSVPITYVQNLASPDVYGLPTSIVTTIDLKTQTSKQEAQFAAIEPDWAAYTALRQNAAVTALLANRPTPMSLDRYSVSKEARGFTTSTSSLNLALPAFLAQFASGTALVSIPAQNVALEASQTNYVWLEASGSSSYAIVVQQTPTTIDNAILFGYFLCSASGIIGSFFAAPVGVFQTGAEEVNLAADLPTPTWTSHSVANGNSLNGVFADVAISVALNNVPTDGTAYQLYFYYRQSSSSGGSGVWVPDLGVNLAIASGTSYPAGTQTISAELGNLAGGTSYDFACAYYGSEGYGPYAIIQSGFVAKTIGIPAAYMLGTTAVTPTVTGASATNGTSGNGINADVIVSFTATNQPTDGSLSKVNFWVRQNSLGGSNTIGASGFAWSPYGGQPAVGVGSTSPPSSGSYTFSAADVTNGQTLDFGITYENGPGNESTVCPVVVGFVAQAINIPAGSLSAALQYLLGGGFANLGIDNNGNLEMPAGYSGIYINKSSESILPNVGSLKSALTMRMRFRNTSGTNLVQFIAFSDSGATGPGYNNGYALNYSLASGGSYGQLTVYKAVSGSLSTLATVTTGVPIPDTTNWHELKLLIYRGSSSNIFSSTKLYISFYLDGNFYGTAHDNVAGGYTSGWCAIGSTGVGEVILDPSDLSISNALDGVSNASPIGIGKVVIGEAESNELGLAGTPNDTALQPGTVSRRTVAGNTTSNMLFNPTAAQNTLGWYPYDSTGSATLRRDSEWGGRFIITVPSGSLSGEDALYYQYVTVDPSQTYTVSGNYYANAVPAGGYVVVDAYAGSAAIAQSIVLTAASGALMAFSFSFTSGSSTTSVQIRLRINTGSTSPTSSSSCAFTALKCEFGSISTPHSDDQATGLVTTTHQQNPGSTDGSNLQSGLISARHLVGGNASDQGAMVDSSSKLLYARHAPALTGVINASGQAPVSTFLNTQGSLLPYTTDVVLTLTAPSGGTSITASTNAGHFYLPDGSAIAASASSHTFTGLSSGATYYVIAYCAATGGTMTFQIASSSGFTPAAYAGYLADGFALLVSPVATPAVGSGGSGGGGGCPGIHQSIETRERGFIRAGDVRTEMHVRHPDGGWRIVEHAGKPMRAALYRVTFDTEAITVDASHLFERELGSDRWENVAALRPGDRFCRSLGNDEIRVVQVHRLQPGLFMPLHVDGMRYKLGKTVSHNVKNRPQ